MADLNSWQGILVGLSWLFFGAFFVVHHILTRQARGEEPAQTRNTELRAPESLLGLALEGVAVAIIFTFRHREGHRPAWVLVLAATLALSSALFAAAALRHLGNQWRVKAVVTADHMLITSGPYRMVRHPIYLALFGMAMASGLLITAWPGLLLAGAVYVIGTEIRVRAEDRILGQRFGPKFDEYKRSVPAYLPFIR